MPRCFRFSRDTAPGSSKPPCNLYSETGLENSTFSSRVVEWPGKLEVRTKVPAFILPSDNSSGPDMVSESLRSEQLALMEDLVGSRHCARHLIFPLPNTPESQETPLLVIK